MSNVALATRPRVAWRRVVVYAGVLGLAACGRGTVAGDAAVEAVALAEVAVEARPEVASEVAAATETVATTETTSAVETVAATDSATSVETVAATDSAPAVETVAATDTAPDLETTVTQDIAANGDATPDAATPDVATAADATPDVATDDIFGAAIPRDDAWWVEGGELHRGLVQTRLRGINWFGLETSDRALQGTWTGRNVEAILAQVRLLGFDSLRIPVGPESINPGFASAAWAANAYTHGPATTGRQHLERLLESARAADFTVLLDFHSCSSALLGAALPGRPDGCPNYDLAHWLADLKTLATLAIGQPHVLGIDLANEPHALTWAAWKNLAEVAGEVVLRANPRLLVFVEGVGSASDDGGAPPFAGENLTLAKTSPPALPASRLVFSPHVYGPGVATQTYFGAENFPANLPAIWMTHFGHLAGTYALVVGEFGGFDDDAKMPGEVAWNDAFVAFLSRLDPSHGGSPGSFYFWALNPNSADTGGLLADDWTTVVVRRLTRLAPLLVP